MCLLHSASGHVREDSGATSVMGINTNPCCVWYQKGKCNHLEKPKFLGLFAPRCPGWPSSNTCELRESTPKPPPPIFYGGSSSTTDSSSTVTVTSTSGLTTGTVTFLEKINGLAPEKKEEKPKEFGKQESRDLDI